MRVWLRRARGLIGLSAAGALVVGGLFGVIASVASLYAYGIVSTFGVVTAIVIGGFFGASTTAGLGLFLAVTAKGKSIEELSLWPGMVIGAAIFGGVVVMVSSLARGTLAPASVALSQFLAFGGFGAVLTGGLLTIARRANRKELEQRRGNSPKTEL